MIEICGEEIIARDTGNSNVINNKVEASKRIVEKILHLKSRFKVYTKSSSVMKATAEAEERDHEMNGVATNVNVNDIDYELSDYIAQTVNKQDGNSDVE
jgi:hypothetical protein